MRFVFALLALAVLSGCTAYQQDGPRYCTTPTTNNPAVTRHSGGWQPGATY